MNYYRKPINKTIDDVRLKMQMAAFTLKLNENNNKIDDLLKADKNIKNDIVDNSNSLKNLYTKEDIDKKDNEILNTINNNFYNRSYFNDNYLIKGNTYDKKYIDDNFLIKSDLYDKQYIDDNFFTKRVLNNSFASYNVKIDSKNNEILKKIENNYYNKSELNTNFNNLYNRTYLDNKFDNIYNKKEINDKINNNSLTDININEINQLTDIDLGKINDSYTKSVFNKIKLDKFIYYLKEFIPFDITLIKKFTIIGNINEIMILQFELDQREFDKNDTFQFFLNITIQYDVSKTNYYRLKIEI